MRAAASPRGASSFGSLLDSRDASAWQAFWYFERREVQVTADDIVALRI